MRLVNLTLKAMMFLFPLLEDQGKGILFGRHKLCLNFILCFKEKINVLEFLHKLKYIKF